MIGILCEKPSAMRNFAKALGGQKGKFNGEDYVITNLVGHVYEYKDPSEQVDKAFAKQYSSWELSNLPWNEKYFKWLYDKKKDASDVIKNAKSVLSACDEICISTDVDPSGEGFLLAAEFILENNLKSKKFTRMYFEDESEKSIKKAFKDRKSIKDITKHYEYLMADYRAKWDFLSMQFTRIATKVGDGHSVLRQGRLKSAMVKLVGDQLKLVDEYVKIPYFQNRFKDENDVIYTSKDEPTYATKDEVPNSYTKSKVVFDGATMKQTPPPKFMDLATLSARLASRGYTGSLVLSTYQKMYEQKNIVSYPRTEDKKITEEQFNDLLPLVDKIAKVVGVDASKLTHLIPRTTHVGKGMAHGANRPGTNVPKSLDDIEAEYGKCGRAIYEMLAKNYLATLAEDYEYEQQKGHLEKYPKFTGTANVPKNLGWKAIFDDDGDDLEDENAKGLGTMADPFVYEGVNPKPQWPTMKWLMKQLEKYDVGTGATRTSTYAEVTSSKTKFPLLEDKRGRITFAQYGKMSYLLLPNTHIGDLKLTERVYKEMKDIGDGKANGDDLLKNIQNYVRDDIEAMKANAITMKAELNFNDAGYEIKEKYAGKWNGKDVEFNRVYCGYRMSDDECEKLLAGEELTLIGCESKNGKFNVRGKLDENTFKGHKYVGFTKIEYVSDDGSKIETNSDDYCTGIWKKKEVKFKRTWSGHKFTDEECADLLAGKEISFEAISKAGKTYTAKGKLANQTFNGIKFVGFKPDFK